MQDKTGFSRLCQTINQISRPPVLILLICIYLVFPLVIFPGTAGQMKHLPLDLMFAYSPEQAYALLTSMEDTGRKSYMFGTTVVDVAYAVVYTLMFSVWLTLIWRGRSRFICAWGVAPLVVFVIDMIENTGIALMLSNFPREIYPLAIATSVATTCKWLLAWPLILTTLLMSLWRGVEWFLARRK